MVNAASNTSSTGTAGADASSRILATISTHAGSLRK